MNQHDTKHIYDLILKAQSGDKEALAQVVAENMGLVYHSAARFYGKGVEKDDLHQIGSIGLISAIKKFDGAFGVRFSTYAVPLILGEIKRFFRDNGPIKVSRDIKKTASDIARISENLEKQAGRPPGVLEIAKALCISPEEVAEALEASVPVLSFSAKIGTGEKVLSDLLKDTDHEPEKIEQMDMEAAVKNLAPRDRTIILMRYFLEKTQSETAKKLGISQVQVSRLEKKILLALKEKLKDTDNTTFSC